MFVNQQPGESRDVVLAVVLDENDNVISEIPVEEVPEETVEGQTDTGLIIPTITITDYDASEEELAAKKLKARERVKQTDSSKGMLR